MIHQMHKNGHVFKEKSLKSMQGLFNWHETTKNGYTQVLYELINRIQMKLGVLGMGGTQILMDGQSSRMIFQDY